MADLPSESATLADGAGEKLVGTTIAGRYKVESLLGSGGMGSVFLVQHTHMRKRFALKILNSQTAQNPEMVARFEREAMAAAHIEHPNVTVAVDFGKAEGGSFFLVLEYLEGQRLRDAMDTGSLPLNRALHIARQIASALERSHELGVIHRDLKPENVMLVTRQGDRDFVKVLDFGLAKVATGIGPAAAGEGKGQALTKLGSVFGTPKYMAPEQCISGPIDGRTDLYALGLILYEMLTGVHPFNSKDNFRLVMHQLNTPIPAMRTAAPAVTIPAALEAVVMRLTEKEPEQRFASATELLAALSEVAEREGIFPPEPSTRNLAHSSRPVPAVKPASTAGQNSPSAEVAMGADPTKGKPGAPTAGGRAVAPPAVNSDSSAVGHPARSASLGGFEATDKPRLEATASSAGPRLADASSPARTLAERLPAPLRKLPPWVLLGAPLGLIVLLVAILGLSGTARKTEPAASKSATKRASTAGIAAPAEAQKQRQLGQTYIEQKNGVEALGAFANAFAFDKNSVTEGDIKQAAALALNVPDSAEAVISLLESRLGAPGVDALYSLESRPGPSQLKARVAQSLSKPELRAHASRAASIALALRAADQCEARRALLPRAAREGDQRTLEQLKLMAQRQNCGPMGLVDCWTCLRQDTALQKAITAIEARLKARN